MMKAKPICPCCFEQQGNCKKETKMNMTKFKMPGGDALMNRFFRRVDGVVWDLMSGKIGVQTKDGVAAIEGEGDDATININWFEGMAVAVPAFAQSTPKEAVNVGDMIYTTGDTPGWVISKSEKGTFKIIRANGTIQAWNPPKVQMFGLDSGVMVVRSLTAMLPGGASGLGNMQSMLLPLIMMGGDDVDLEKMMPMLLFMQTGAGGTPGADPAVGGNAMMQMLQMQIMMQMIGGDRDDISPRKSYPFR